ALEELGIIDDVLDGEFLVKVQDRGDELVGRFTLEDIRVRTASPIVSLLDAISLVGLLQQMNGPGLRFDKVTGNFRMIEEGIEIDDVSAVGASLGFTTAGVYVPSENRVDLEGTVTPIYALNGLFERVFKKPFGRDTGEGLFSFTYRMRGDAADPRVRVNPISILLPGFMREIVRPKTPRLKARDR
ncbi:MAG: AsmA-like C-terminal region-containing protein, partial [Pseudomonadota bacterium]